MSSSDRKDFLYYFLPVALFNLIIYFPSFFHIPRSDQLVYLADVAYQQDWFTLTLKNYAFNRLELPFDMKDDLLFRPVVYIFLGLEKWLFGNNFMYWQITGFLLHLTVIWLLLKLLLQVRESFFAVMLVTFFSVLNAGVEMVIWTNVNSYLIFIICILKSFYELQKFIINGRLCLRSLVKIVIALTIATLTYELGILYCFLFAIYFYLIFVPKDTKTHDHSNIPKIVHSKFFIAAIICIPIILYLTFDFLDLVYRGFKLSLEGQQILQFKNIANLIKRIPLILFWWIYVGLFPSQFVILSRQRTVIYPLYILKSTKGIFPLSGPNLIPVLLGIAAICVYFAILRRGISFNYIKYKWRILSLLFCMIVSYVCIISLGRISIRGIARILADNSYYNYFFWTFFVLFIYYSIPFDHLPKVHSLTFLRKLTKALLIMLIFVNTAQTSLVIRERTLSNKAFRILNENIQNLIHQHGSQEDFSFGIDPILVNKNQFEWIKNKDIPEKKYNFFELLYPQYYREIMPKYLFFLDQNGNWRWQKME